MEVILRCICDGYHKYRSWHVPFQIHHVFVRNTEYPLHGRGVLRRESVEHAAELVRAAGRYC